MQRQSSIQQEDGTLTNPLLQGHHVHVHQPISPDPAAPADQALQTESLAETHAKVAEVVRAMRPLLLAWLAISVALAAELIAYLIAFAGSMRAFEGMVILGLIVAGVGIAVPVAYHIPACFQPLWRGRRIPAEEHVSGLHVSWSSAMNGLIYLGLVMNERPWSALSCEAPTHLQSCTKAWWLHVALFSTLGAYVLVAGCVSFSAKRHLRRLKQEREAAELAAELKTADV